MSGPVTPPAVPAEAAETALAAFIERLGAPWQAPSPADDPVAYREALGAALSAAYPLIAQQATANPERTHDVGLPLPPCTCDCRQCGFSCHCSACYKDRRQKALRRALDAAAAAERQRWLTVLADHYLAGISCDPDTKRDNPVCGCSRVFLGWHPSIGEARQAWIDHVAECARRLP